jgi:hypothetical protein
MSENIVETTTEVAPSKLASLKSKITREGLIVGGILIGATIAGAWVLLKNPTLEDDSVTIETHADGSFTVSNTDDTPDEN